MATEQEVKEALQFIDPATLSYQDWLNVGMAIKDDGHPCSLWDEWSRRDPQRYDGKCWAKWETLQGDGITIKTLFKMAYDGGYKAPGYSGTNNLGNRELLDNEIIDVSDIYRVIDEHDVNISIIPPCPNPWNQIEDIRKYISVLFEQDDYVSYCTKCYQSEDGKFHPSDRNYDRRADRLLAELGTAKKIEDVFYDYNHDCGAWISFNPVDGTGGSDSNVTDFRYTLVESDTQDINVQYSLMMELQLPIVALVHSGNKSIHAICRVDASSRKEYKERVHKLLEICKKNGLNVDVSAKNASRLSRMPGFWRGNKPQYLIATNIGCESWDAWIEYIESINDDLPDPEDFSEILKDLPELAPELIYGVLRKGHKMLLSGGSKTGKSMLMIQLAIAIATGGHWLNRYCAQGKVLYVNLEIDRASFYKRLTEACEKRAIDYEKIRHNLIIWNLRGHSTTLDKLAPKLIRRCQKGNYTAVIIDPAYKVMMGDENKAGDMAQFCNQFDRIATQLNCAVIYVHHFSKGDQDKKASIDRASGSGVFARDPDVISTVTKLNSEEPAVRVEFTLREFPDMDPIDAWYRYPIHVVDDTGELKTKKLAGAKKKETQEDRVLVFVDLLNIAYQNLSVDEDGSPKTVTQSELMEWMNKNSGDRTYPKSTFNDYYKIARENGWTNLKKKGGGKKGTDSFFVMDEEEGDGEG